MSDDNPTDDTVDNPTDTTWRDALSETLKEDASLTKFDDVESLAKSYINAQNLIGRDKIPMPNSESEFRDVYQRLGMPEDSNGYEFTDVEFPEGITKPENTGLNEIAHTAGLNNTQADIINKWYFDNILNVAQDAQSNRNQKTEQSLKDAQKEWGDGYKGNVELAKRVLRDFGDDSSKEYMEKTGLGSDINVLRVFANIGNKLVEDRVMEGHSSSGDTPSTMRAQISKLQSNPAYMDKHNPDHKNIAGQVEDLYKSLYPE